MDESLWSARNIAEYAYCPRLFYYMQVEGVFVPSSDTELGKSIHRRVDRPSMVVNEDKTEEDPECPKVIRSLVLTDQFLKLTATLDLAEISGECATPVEYRKGKPKKQLVLNTTEYPDQEIHLFEPWPSDLVQIGLQSILLEKAGYKVREALIYYAEEKRKIRVSVDESLKTNALEILEQAKLCASGVRPLPLLNDPKCPKCSLQQVCLPDEINQQRALQVTDELTPRKIWPPRDDGSHVVVQQEGARIGVRGMELRVIDKSGCDIKTIPLTNVETVSVLGNIQISTQTIHSLSNMSIPVAFLSPAGRLVAMIDPLDSVSADIRRAQVRLFDRPEICLELAKILIQAKILNQRTLLIRNHLALPDGVAHDLANLAKAALHADSLDALRGHEGLAASIYFRYFPEIFKDDVGLEFKQNGRQRRPPPDPVNACLSFAYSMLTHECVSALRLARLEPSIGAFHISKPGRPALALDLMEPFRPLIADSIAITCFNKGELTEGHFLRTAAGCVFTEPGRKAFFNALGRRMNTEVTHPVFDYRLSYRRMIILHARMIAAWIMGEIPSLSFLTTR